MRKFNILYDSKYKNKQLLERKSDEQGFHKEILDRVIFLIEYMTNKRKRTYGIIIGVNFPQDKQYPHNNQLFLQFLNNFIDYFNYKNIDTKYLWVLEKKPDTTNIHYHILLLMDGYQTKSFYLHGLAAVRKWSRVLGVEAGGLIYYENTGVFLDKDRPDYLENCNNLIKWSSYITKVRDKVNFLDVRNWNSSQIP